MPNYSIKSSNYKKCESLMSFKVDALPPGVNVGFYFTTTAFPIYGEWFSKKNQYFFSSKVIMSRLKDWYIYLI